MFKSLSNLTSIMKQAQQMGSRMGEMQERLKAERATGSAGAGMVEVEVNGLGEVLKVTVEPSLIEKGDREMIEDLLPTAINQAVSKSKQLSANAMQSLTDGLDVPGLGDAISQITGSMTDKDDDK